MTLTLSHSQRRRMQKVADRVDKVTQSDRRFFERFPHRQHRVRVASQAEIEQFALLMGLDAAAAAVPPGYEHYVLIKNLAPGVRFRRPITSRAGNDTDVDEAEARWLYESTLTDQAREIEAKTLKLAEGRA